MRLGRYGETFQIPGVVGENVDSVRGDDHGVGVPKPSDLVRIHTRFDREHHSRLDAGVVADIEERGLVVAQPDPCPVCCFQ